MDCRKAQGKISAYLDAETDSVSSRDLEAHVRECADCRAMLDGFQRLDALVRGLPGLQLGPDFAKQMVMRAKGLERAGEIKSGLMRPLFYTLLSAVQDLSDLVSRARPASSTRTLDEFDDFPPLSMGYIYFRLLDLPTRG
jgi:hypothetical protein